MKHKSTLLEMLQMDDFAKSEVSNIYWFKFKSIILYKTIFELRQKFIFDNGWEMVEPEDSYANSKQGAIDWYASLLLNRVYIELLKQCPSNKVKHGKSVSEVFREIDMRAAYSKRVYEEYYASREERKKFYESIDWAYIKYLRFHRDFGYCSRCDHKTLIPEVNHLYPLAKECYPALFIRNLSLDHVQTFCRKCHLLWHSERENTGIEFLRK